VYRAPIYVTLRPVPNSSGAQMTTILPYTTGTSPSKHIGSRGLHGWDRLLLVAVFPEIGQKNASDERATPAFGCDEFVVCVL